MKLEIDVKLDRVSRALDETVDPKRRRDALRAVGRAILSRIQLGFRTGTSPYGEKWKPPVLRAGQPLIDTSRLRDSFSRSAVRVEETRVVIGTNVEYAPTHQFGAVITPKRGKFLAVPYGGSAGGQNPTAVILLRKATIPARPFMPLKGSASAPVADLPYEWAQSAINAMAKAFAKKPKK